MSSQSDAPQSTDNASKDLCTGRNKLEAEIEEFLQAYLPENPPIASEKVVHDSLWGTSKLSSAEVSFLDTPLLQRLRQIRQTGFAYMTYPSTTHSRFEHTLGVVLNIKRLGEALINDKGDKRLTETDLQQLRIAGLLHDIGHGPFSHTSEEVYGTLPQFELFKKGFSGREAPRNPGPLDFEFSQISSVQQKGL